MTTWALTSNNRMSATASHGAFFPSGNTHEQHLVVMVPEYTKQRYIVRVAFLWILHIISDEFYQQRYVKCVSATYMRIYRFGAALERRNGTDCMRMYRFGGAPERRNEADCMRMYGFGVYSTSRRHLQEANTWRSYHLLIKSSVGCLGRRRKWYNSLI